jgi:hypothetical protein
VVQGLETLKRGLDRDKKPLKFGTLVVFSDGADRASRVSRDEMRDGIAKPEYEHYELFAIGIGEKEELEQAQLSDIGRDGTEEGSDRTKVKDAFDRIAGRIESHTKRFYLLSYCTPSRKGQHSVRIDVNTPKATRKGRSSTSSRPTASVRRRRAIPRASPRSI